MAEPSQSAPKFYLGGDESDAKALWFKANASTKADRYCGLVLRVSVLYAGNDIIEEPDAVIPHVRICVGASQ